MVISCDSRSHGGKLGGVGKLIQRATNLYFMKIFQLLLGQHGLSVDSSIALGLIQLAIFCSIVQTCKKGSFVLFLVRAVTLSASHYDKLHHQANKLSC